MVEESQNLARWPEQFLQGAEQFSKIHQMSGDGVLEVLSQTLILGYMLLTYQHPLLLASR